ncbi:MAG: LytTR family DNA-binding domain-containing protein [Thermincolia bacterium]
MEKDLKKAVFHTINGKYSCTETLAFLETKLNNTFFRCHKSFIINVKKLEKISPIADRIYEVTFYNYSLTVTMGRAKYEELLNLYV